MGQINIIKSDNNLFHLAQSCFKLKIFQEIFFPKNNYLVKQERKFLKN